GKTDAGAPAADGAYTMAVAAQRGNDKVAARPLELGMVSSVVRTSDGASLNVGALGVFKMSDVRQIL
ncbi:MAG: hypothetical protein WA094_14990, partial [Candidatus Desulfobacillus denitrificans]